jgi:hypothetical protein
MADACAPFTAALVSASANPADELISRYRNSPGSASWLIILSCWDSSSHAMDCIHTPIKKRPHGAGTAFSLSLYGVNVKNPALVVTVSNLTKVTKKREFLP